MAQNIKIVGPSSDGTTLENSGSLKQVDVKVDDSGGLNSHTTEFDPMLSGETFPDKDGGWIYVNAGADDIDLPDVTTATGSEYTAYATNGQVILGFKYFGSGSGYIGVTTFNDTEKKIPVVDATLFGPQIEPIKCKTIHKQNHATNPSSAIDGAEELLVYLSKDVVS